MLNNNSSESSTSLPAKSVINLLVKNFDNGGVNGPLMKIDQWTTAVASNFELVPPSFKSSPFQPKSCHRAWSQREAMNDPHLP